MNEKAQTWQEMQDELVRPCGGGEAKLRELVERWRSYYPDTIPESAAYQEARRTTRLRADELEAALAQPAPVTAENTDGQKTFQEWQKENMISRQTAREGQAIWDAATAAARVRALDEAVAAVEQAYSRNMSGENWHSRAINSIRALAARDMKESK
jgi:hypothetical protein